MNAQILQFPRAEKSRVAPGTLDDQIDGLLVDLMPRLHIVSDARDDLDERFHRFLVKRGLVKEENC